MGDAFFPDHELVDAYHWLMSEDSAAAAETVSRHKDSLHQLVRKLQRAPHHLTGAEISLAIKHPELRQKAAYKFRNPDRMWFAETLLEQATDEAIANYKASRFPASEPVTDICCGLGGDLLALASRGPVAAVDRSPVALLLAQANVRSRKRDPTTSDSVRPAAEYFEQDATEHIEQVFANRPDGRRWAHVDPDRRADGMRTSAWDYTEPGPHSLERLRQVANGLAIKLAPATIPPAVEDCERDWIGSRGQCRQQVLWCGELAQYAGQATATVVAPLRSPHDPQPGQSSPWERFIPSSTDVSIPWADEPGPFLLEPHAAILAAQLGEAYGAEHDLMLAAPHGGYLTGARDPGATLLASRFVVESWLPFDAKRVRKQLRAHNPARLDIKRRGIPETPDQIAKKLKWKPDRKSAEEGDTLTLVVARLQTRVVAMFCRRLK